MDLLYINGSEFTRQEESGDCQLEDEVPVYYSKRNNKTESAGKKKITIAPYDVSNKRYRSGKGIKSIKLEELGIELRDEEEELEEDEEFDDKDVKKVQDDFKKGRVVYGNNKACVKLLNQVNEIRGKQGVISWNIMDEICISKKKSYDVSKNYERGILLGEGGVGKVYHVCDNVSKKYFVEKTIKKQSFARKEVEVLLNLQHKNITDFYGLLMNDDMISVFMSYVGLSLEALVFKNKMTFTEEDIIFLSIQAMSALAHMHQYGIIHMDIKPQNICIKLESKHLSLTDFGSSLTPQQPLDFFGLTPEYMSPELCQLYVNFARLQQNKQPQYQISREELNGKNDVYGLACTILFIFLRNHAALMFSDRNDRNNFRVNYLLKVAAHPQLMRCCVPYVPNTIQDDLKSIVMQLLNGDVKHRPSAEEGKYKLEEIQQTRRGIQPTDQPLEDEKHASIKLKLKRKIEGNRRTDNSRPSLTKPPEIPQMVDTTEDESLKTDGNQNIPNFDSLF